LEWLNLLRQHNESAHLSINPRSQPLYRGGYGYGVRETKRTPISSALRPLPRRSYLDALCGFALPFLPLPLFNSFGNICDLSACSTALPAALPSDVRSLCRDRRSSADVTLAARIKFLRVFHVRCMELPIDFGSVWKTTRTKCNTCNTESYSVLTARNRFLFVWQGFNAGWGTRIRT
jgi:hypothetical protein